MNSRKPVFHIDECHFKQADGIPAEATLNHAGSDGAHHTAMGNGRLMRSAMQSSNILTSIMS